MKDIVKTALHKAYKKAEEIAAKYLIDTEEKERNITGYTFEDLKRIMQDIENPESAYITGSDCHSGAYLHYKVTVNTTAQNKERYKAKEFDKWAWKYVKDELLKNGYKRFGNMKLKDIKDFENETIYKMYSKKKFNRLVRYYSIYFKKL